MVEGCKPCLPFNLILEMREEGVDKQSNVCSRIYIDVKVDDFFSNM